MWRFWIFLQCQMIFWRSSQRERFLEFAFRILEREDRRTGYKLVEKACRHSDELFDNAGKVRKSGKPYKTHNYGVAYFLILGGATEPEMIAAALLHDVLEEFENITEGHLRDLFTPLVAELVGICTIRRPEMFSSEEDRVFYHFEALRRYARAMKIKLANRIHNQWTIWPMGLEKTRLKTAETRAQGLVASAKELGFLYWTLQAALLYGDILVWLGDHRVTRPFVREFVRSA